MGSMHNNKAAKEQGSLKIVSYNILGEKAFAVCVLWYLPTTICCTMCSGALHAESQKHSYALPKITTWTSRRQKLVEELKVMDADIYCLQEVTDRGLRETFMPALKEMGMECVGHAPMRGPGLTTKQPSGNSTSSQDLSHDHFSIGCSIFCKTGTVQVLSSKRVFLRDFAPIKNSKSHVFNTDIRLKLNTMVMILVKIVGTNKTAIIANTHLHWDPARVDIKNTQAVAVAEAIERFAEVSGYTKENTPPVILCGDFNVVPYQVPAKGWSAEEGDVLTGLFELFTTGTLSNVHPEHPDQWHTKVRSQVLCPRIGAYNTNLRLRNAYFLPEFAQYAPQFTTKTDDFQGWIDHIWVNDKVEVAQAMVPPVYRGDIKAGALSRAFMPIPDEVSLSNI